MSNGTTTSGTPGLKLQYTFVAMLFALAAASVATSAADVFSLMGSADEFFRFLPAISHMILALLVISMSWIEWSRAMANRAEKDRLRTMVEWRFLLLLLDVGLVVLYFLLAREIEIREVLAEATDGYVKRMELADPSSSGEIKWSIWIFGGYLIYDFAIDVIMNKPWNPWLCLRNMIVGCFASVLSIGLLFGIRSLVSSSPTAVSVVWTDVAIVAVFAVFRLLKGLEYYFAGWFRIDKTKNFRKRTEFQKSAIIISSLFILVAVVGFILLGRASCEPSTDNSTQAFTMTTDGDSRPVVYIASPYSKGDPAINTHFQCSVFDRLMNDGRVLPVAPLWSHFQHTLFPRRYEDWVSYDLALLARYDACLRLAAEVPALGYAVSESSGADGEVKKFEEMGKPVFRSVEELYSWVDALESPSPKP